ncbi:MAG TPA: hypothetical protein VGO00_18415 [Kofleriaceae bacterium]|jgi:hypothetical protein|nr:hypothetical protein [Kofleriaceae bacterium]
MRITASLFVLVPIVVAACSEPQDPPAVDPSEINLEVSNVPCATLPPDDTFYVPNTFANKTIPSGNGSYAYVRSGAPSTCGGYIVDVWMATYSALNPIDGYNSGPGQLEIEGEAYDLPGSAVVNGTMPTNHEDCVRLATVLLAYTWPHTDVGYTYVGGLMRTGHWQDGYCSLVTSSIYGSIPKPKDSSSGWDKYRYAVAALERTTYQESAIHLSLSPPE